MRASDRAGPGAGDPHINTFDGGRPSFYGEGEYYIVKSDSVIIQGRYLGTKYTAGLAATDSIAVGGDFLKGHVIAVGSLRDGPIVVDGMPVLTRFPSEHVLEGVGVLKYSGEGELVDQATKDWEKKVVTMELPGDVRVEVFRWANYLDLRITMPAQPNQDGSCGNMNADAGDDTTEVIGCGFRRSFPSLGCPQLLQRNTRHGAMPLGWC